MIRYKKTHISRTQTEVLEEYRQVVQRLGHLPTEGEIAQETHRSRSSVHRHLGNLRELTGEALPTRGWDYWRTLLEENQVLKSRLNGVSRWLQERDQESGVNLAGSNCGEWASDVNGRLELLGILGERRGE